MTIAVVVPVLNEATVLPNSLRSLQLQTRPPDRLVVVDGGSTDGTAGVARSFGTEVLIVTGRGRGGQIAAGVRTCTEDAIVIAHADMQFLPAALETIQSFLMLHPVCPGGCLGHRFDNSRRIYRVIEWWDRRRALRGHSFGDQAQFFRRELLERVGGFPELPLMEDVELARRLRRLGRPAYLDLPVTVSTRRYQRLGWWRVMWRNWRLRRLYRREGEAACWRLYRRYYV
jgi:rSAM/selenodomain-associated transferase 2